MPHAFTLVELLVVISILAILMGIGVGAFSYANRRIADTRTRTLIKQIEVAMESYKQEFGYYPQKATIGSFSVQRDTAVDKGDFTYFLDFEPLKQNNTRVGTASPPKTWYTFVDGYGSDLLYRCPGFKNKTSFDLASKGPDGRYGESTTVNDASSEAQKYGQLGKADDITNFTP
jgi:prepilin-type N-terminal cleavage/methylation domain-containing protein